MSMPGALISGGRVRCPGARHAACPRSWRLGSRRALRSYRRHWLRAHA